MHRRRRSHRCSSAGQPGSGRCFSHGLYYSFLLKGPLERSVRLICCSLYLLLENGGAFYGFSASGTNAVSPRLKGAEAGGLVYFWSVSPMVQGGGWVLYLTVNLCTAMQCYQLASLQSHGTALWTPSHSVDISFHGHCPDLHITSMNNKEQVLLQVLIGSPLTGNLKESPLTLELITPCSCSTSLTHL